MDQRVNAGGGGDTVFTGGFAAGAGADNNSRSVSLADFASAAPAL